tara:strand:+ start:801 stop:1457 length:657 start_codon:yes stop_codon:yes gene_type:complete
MSVIHQIFINMGKGELKQIPDFQWPHEKTKVFCLENDIQNILWSKKDIEDLLEDYPEYKEFYYGMRYDIQRVDFARLLILYHHGGIYLDLDVRPFPKEGKNIKELFEKEIFIARWWDSHLPYNAILGCHKGNPLMKEALNHCVESCEQKSKMEIYNKWTARFVFQTTGHYMLHRVFKNKVDYLPIVSVYNEIKKICNCVPNNEALFYDMSASIWYEKK